MTYFFQIITSGMAAFLLTVVLIPISMKLAHAIGAIDYPGKIKIHSQPIPRFGGLAIFTSVVIISLLSFTLFRETQISANVFIPASLIGIFLLGFFDDVKNIPARIKLLFQMINVLLAVIGVNSLFDPVAIMYVAFSYFFMLTFVNAFNFIDGLDGLASGLAIIIASGLLIISLVFEQQFTAFGLVLVVGASFGFLIFNMNPARIFLGDCGSTFLGFLLSLMIVHIWLSAASKFTILPLLLIAGVPLVDITNVITRRLLQHKSIFQGDRNHLYDLLLKKGYSLKQTLLIVYTVEFILMMVGIFLYILIEH